MATARGKITSRSRGDKAYRETDGKRNVGKNKPMSEQQLVGFLGRKIHQSMNTEEGDLSDIRKENFNLYIGAEMGDEREGYSQFVTREVLETIEWVLPSVLRVFLSGDRIVSFQPEGPEDEDVAKQETDITNHYVMKENNGGNGSFQALHNWMKDTLMNPNGYVKAYMCEEKRIDVGMVTGINEFGLKSLQDDPDITILEQETKTTKVQTPQGVAPVTTFDLKIRYEKEVRELRIEAVPPEECLVDNDLTSLNLDEADFVCHRRRRTFTDLVNAGYDPDQLDLIGQQENHQWNDERTNRLFYEDEDPDAEDIDDPSMRQFWVHECNVLVDYDGDGVAERRQITMIGDQVFDNEEVNYQPMVSMAAVLMPHKHTGLSYVDIVKDLQILKTVLTRQLLDNAYKLNVGKKYFNEDALTDDGATIEAMDNTQAEHVPVRGLPQQAVWKEQYQSIIQDLVPVIDIVNQSQAVRTGVTPEAGVAANDLQEVRQEVFTNALDRASQRIEMLVRIFAETGFRQLMLKVHQLLRSHWDIAKAVKIRGEWIDVDPAGWRHRTNLSVEVGLGFNTKTQIMGMLVQMLQMQREAVAEGMSDGGKIYHTLGKLVNAAGLGDVGSYFIDPNSPEFQPPQPQPDPNMMVAQATMMEQERKQQEFQVEAQRKQVETQAEIEGGREDRALKRAELKVRVAELQRDAEKSGLDIREQLAGIEDTLASADKKMAEAAATITKSADEHRESLRLAAEGGEANTQSGGSQDETGGSESEDS